MSASGPLSDAAFMIALTSSTDVSRAAMNDRSTIDTLMVGKSGSHTFSTKGRVDVRCGLHPGMRLVVTVQ